jgi:hypothetical protein
VLVSTCDEAAGDATRPSDDKRLSCDDIEYLVKMLASSSSAPLLTGENVPPECCCCCRRRLSQLPVGSLNTCLCWPDDDDDDDDRRLAEAVRELSSLTSGFERGRAVVVLTVVLGDG